MHELKGGCHCGNIQLQLTLTRAAGEYRPRACDCDFCVKHAAAYLSDPQGSLHLHIRDAGELAEYRQGSGQAVFLVCRICGVLVGVRYENQGRLHAAVNAKAINGGRDFGPEQAVSPKTLAAEAKVQRWQEVWFADVRITQD